MSMRQRSSDKALLTWCSEELVSLGLQGHVTGGVRC